jgi:hypothetical protein
VEIALEKLVGVRRVLQVRFADVAGTAGGASVCGEPSNQPLASFQVPIVHPGGGRRNVRPSVETYSVTRAPGSHRNPRVRACRLGSLEPQPAWSDALYDETPRILAATSENLSLNSAMPASC